MQNNNRRINLRIKRIAGSSLNKFGEGKFSISNQRQEKRKKSGKQVYGNQVRKGKSVFACCCSELSSSSALESEGGIEIMAREGGTLSLSFRSFVIAHLFKTHWGT